MVRVTSETMVSGSQLYSYLEIDGRGTNATASYYDLRGGVTSGFYWDLTCSSFLKWWENGSGHDIDSGSGYYGGYSDLQLVSSDSFAVTRTSSDRYITFECYSTSSLGSGSARYTVEVPHLPGAPTNLTATRVSDNRIDLSWTNPSLSYGGFYLQVSIDGGSWSNAWSVENVMPTSYSYTQASAGHSYKFRAYTGHWYAYSAFSNETAIITMTPAAPQSISVAASGGTNVTVTLTNNSPVATSLEYQTSTDGGSTWSASTTVSGSPVTSFSTSVSGTALIRVRNKNATGVSAWLVSDPITTICPPAPPTLRTPSGSVYDMALGDIEFSWLHNSLDGSTQTAYQLRYARNGGAWTTLSGTTAQSRTVSLGTFTAGDSVTWQVRTKGADANYSDWSPSGVFNVYTAPTVSISSPGATITGMPISLTATYSDMAGFTCQAAAVSMTKDGRTLYSESATINGTSITSSLDVSEFLPTNGETYTVVVTARSSSSLQATANATFTTAFTEPQAGELNIVNDPETGYASLLATFDNSASEITYSGDTNAQYDSEPSYVKSLTVEGRSEKWNQHGRFAKMTDYSIDMWGSAFNAFTIAPDGLSASVSNTRLPNTTFTIDAERKGHKLYFSLDVAVTGTFTNRFVVNFGGTIMQTVLLQTGTPNHITAIGTMGLSYNYLYIYPNGTAASQAVTCDYTFANFKLVDLTAIFGAGNEPATVDAFKATDVYKAKLAAGEQYDYDAGSLVSIEGVGVSGRNLLPLRFYKGLGYNAAEGADKTSTLQEVSDVTQSGNTFTRSVAAWGDMSMISDRLTAGTYKLSCHVTSENMRMTGYTLTSDLIISRRLGNYASPNEMDYTPTVTLTADECYIAFSVGSASAGNVTITAPMLVYGSTAHAYEPYSLATITTPLRSAGSVHDQLQAGKDSWTVERKVGTRAYASGDESDPDVLTDGTTTYYALTTPTTDTPTSMSTIEIGSAFTIGTDLDSTFSMTAWDGSADAVSISVSRVNADGTITPLLTDGASGAGIVDRYAPLNTAYQYAVTTTAASKAVRTVYVDNIISSQRWFAYWGGNIAWARWNPKGGVTITRPEKKRVHYVGRTYPVSYDSLAIDQQNTLKVTALLDEWSDGFADLMRDGGRGVYKGADGSVFWADFEYSTSADYASATRIDEMSLTITRIDGEKL